MAVPSGLWSGPGVPRQHAAVLARALVDSMLPLSNQRSKAGRALGFWAVGPSIQGGVGYSMHLLTGFRVAVARCCEGRVDRRSRIGRAHWRGGPLCACVTAAPGPFPLFPLGRALWTMNARPTAPHGHNRSSPQRGSTGAGAGAAGDGRRTIKAPTDLWVGRPSSLNFVQPRPPLQPARAA